MALILSRRPNQSIDIGPDVRVTILEVCGRVVKVEISAPDSVHILRTELVGKPKPEKISEII